MIRFAKYSLSENFIDHWLVAGPLVSRSSNTGKLAVLNAVKKNLPVELETIQILNTELQWNAFTSQPDHFLDLTSILKLGDRCYSAWSYSEILSPANCSGQIRIAGFGPLEIWVNDLLIFSTPQTGQVNPWQEEKPLSLRQGKNSFLIRMVACPGGQPVTAAAVRLNFNQVLHVHLPVTSELTPERAFMERTFEAATTDRYIVSEDQHLVVRWPAGYAEQSILDLQVRQEPSRVFSMTEGIQVKADSEIPLIQSYDVSDGAYQLRLMPRLEHYAGMKLRIKRDIPIFFARNKFHTSAEDHLLKRADEFVRWAYQQVNDPWGVLAQMAAGRWNLVNFDLLWQILHPSQLRTDALLQLCLIGMVYRYGSHESFPPDLKQAIYQSMVEWDLSNSQAWHEGEALCQAVIEMLSGQLLPGQAFTHTPRSGSDHAHMGTERVQSWLKQRALTGFSDWNASNSIESAVVGLTHIIDLAQSEDLQEMAGVLLDKLLFSLAIANFKGISGAPRSQATIPQVFGARFDPLSAISRLLWGQGSYSIHLAGAASLLCAAGYSVPEILNQIAADTLPSLWMKECQPGLSGKTNISLYKTPEALLASAQVPAPGTAGASEQVWQASFSPDAVVFTSAPANFSLDSSHKPNFWCGNAVLPQIHQWKNTLVAIYQLPPENWCGFTHAYFPEFAFDEVDFMENWTFARKGEAYLALLASQGIERITSGDSAFRELRSYGKEQVWLCRVGSQDQDGAYPAFKEKMLQAQVDISGNTVSCRFADGLLLACGYQLPLVVAGQALPEGGEKHYDTPYAVTEFNAPAMDISFGQDTIRLNFE